uniref:Transposase Tc1-like domain-containing protein n=1 Tax=Dicentrarchus labrax TaxID=13489 RepID=A0A8P4KQ24_DICLA
MWHQFQHSVGIKSCVISRLASRHRTTGRVRDRPRSGAPRVTDRNDDQYLRTYALRHHYATATQLQARLRDVRGTRVSRQTIRNRLHRFGLNARRPLQVTPLTPRHPRERLQWAQDRVTWTMQQWSTVLTPPTFCSWIMLHHIVPELSQLDFRKSECLIWYDQQCPLT